MAKWPGSALWFPAVITGVGEDGDSYDLKFEDGFEDEFAEKHVTVCVQSDGEFFCECGLATHASFVLWKTDCLLHQDKTTLLISYVVTLL